MDKNKSLLFFHVFNRGVDKRKVFMNTADYYRFIHDLYEFNDTRPTNPNYTRKHSNDGGSTSIIRKRELLVNIHCFCVMPNHYHLLLSTEDQSSLTTFMRKIGTGYTLYFNEKYDRSGCLFQGRYKSILVESNDYLVQLSKYIHLNPIKDHLTNNLVNYKYSSYLDYIGKKNLPSLIDRSIISKQFGSHDDYRYFVGNDEPINVESNYRID